jgi:PAS domain S-box-containing protein
MESGKEKPEREWTEKEIEERTVFLDALIENSPLAIVVVDHEHKVRMCNPAFVRLFGYPEGEIISLPLDELIAPPELRDEAAGLTRQAVEGEVVRALTKRRRKDGSLVEVEVHGVPLRVRGELVGGYGLYLDITERKQAEQALRASAQDYRGLFEQAHDAILVFNPEDEVILDVNQRACEVYGFTREEFLGMSLKRISQNVPRGEQQIRETLERGVYHHFETVQFRKDGSRMALEINAAVVNFKGRRAILSIHRDVTDRKRAEEALRESESRNRAILDALPDLMFIQNADGVYLDYHASDPGLLFVPPERFLGKNMREVLPPELSARFAELFGLLWETGVTQVLEYPLRLSGEARFFEARIAACGPDRVLSLIRDITARKQASSALQQRQREADTLLDSLPAYAYFKKAGSVYVAANRKFCEAVGCPQSKIAGKSDYDLFPRELAEKFRTDDARTVITGEILWVGEEEMVDRGRRFVVETRKVPVKDEKGTVVGLIGLGFDITERKQLEAQLLQSQKMEAVGRLAGGVAHDFNNILTAIMGYSDVLLSKLPPEDPLRRFPEGILETVDRASNLTNQLLAFSRRQEIQTEVLSLNDVVADMDRLLRRLIGEDVELISDLEPTLGPVKADPVQLEQVLLNLAVNARDAMSRGAGGPGGPGGPGGGRLTIKTSNVELDLDFVRRHVGLEPGPYVLLSVTDTGRGMGPDVQAHLFEPFFTTKDKGKGTGLGLSTVYGIVKQTGGHIEVESAPGAGAAFRVFLPRHTGGPGEEAFRSPVPGGRGAEPARSLQGPGGTETILVVEDDEGVRKRACEILQGYGYVVREAGHGEEALAVAVRHPGPIHLLVADVVMPRVSGPELARRLAPSRPEMKVLFISGYTDGELAPYGVLKEGTSLLRKPFKPEALARRVRALLDAP